eukprot:TRINITY_DN6313_c0_g2_i1.p1 TRINITY_DN6313_c0_g2~~TRINITY_DN6313_c0_g2_i1.p1  ORF type:complete len:599 (-),score=72.51 TRINITY_DN6313_c0_g2_i1:55-1851(-)
MGSNSIWQQFVLIATVLMIATTLHGCFGSGGESSDTKEDTKKDTKTESKEITTTKQVVESGDVALACPVPFLGVMLCKGDSASCAKEKAKCYRITTGRENLAWCYLDEHMHKWEVDCQGPAGERQTCTCPSPSGGVYACSCKCPQLVSNCKGEYDSMMREIEWNNEHGVSSSRQLSGGSNINRACPSVRFGVMMCQGSSAGCMKQKSECYRITTGGEKLAWCYIDKFRHTWEVDCRGPPGDVEKCSCPTPSGGKRPCACKCPELVSNCKSAYDSLLRAVEFNNERGGSSMGTSAGESSLGTILGNPNRQKACPVPMFGLMTCQGGSASCVQEKKDCYRITTGREKLAWCYLDAHRHTWEVDCRGPADAQKTCSCESSHGMVPCDCKCPELVNNCKSAYDSLMREVEWRNVNGGVSRRSSSHGACPSAAPYGVMMCQGDTAACVKQKAECYRVTTGREKLAWCFIDKFRHTWEYDCKGPAGEKQTCSCPSPSGGQRYCSCKCPQLVSNCKNAYDSMMREIEWQNEHRGTSLAQTNESDPLEDVDASLVADVQPPEDELFSRGWVKRTLSPDDRDVQPPESQHFSRGWVKRTLSPDDRAV